MLKYKQLIFGILIGALLFGGIFAIADTQIQAVISDITVTLNGTPLQLEDPPIMYQDRTYLPVRKIAEAVGKHVDWDEASNTVIIEEVPVAEVDKAEYISLDEARRQCPDGYDIIPNGNQTLALWHIVWVTEGKTELIQEIILADIPLVYIDWEKYIPLAFFNENVLPLLE